MTKKLRFLMTALLFAVCGLTWASSEEVTFNNTTSVSGNNVTFTFAKGSASNAPALNNGQVRLYAKNTMTIKSTGKYLESVVFTVKVNQNNSGKYPSSISASTGDVDPETLELSTTTITWTAEDEETSEVTLTVGGTAGNIQFASGVVTYVESEGPVKLDATVEIDNTTLEIGDEATITTNGPELTLTTGNSAIATVSGNKITAVGAGTTTITASWDEGENENGYFKADSKEFTITVFAPENVEDGEFDFTGTYRYGTTLQPSSNQSNIESVTWVAGNVTLVTTNCRYWYNANGNTLRIYKNDTATGTATISVPEGYVIKSINATGSQLNLLSDEDNNAISSWDGSAQSVQFTVTASGNANAQIKTITVTYMAEGEKMDATVTIGQNTLKVGQSTTVNTDGPTIQLSTSDADVASVSGNTITAVGEGTATITATWDEDDEYNAGSETFEITVNAASGTIVDGLFDFSFEDELDYGTGLTPSTNSTNLTSSTWKAGNVTLAIDGGHRWWSATGGNELRLYSGSTATISVPQGYVITKIVFDADKLDVTANVGVLNTKTWTGSSQSVEFTRNGNTYISSITVTYEQAVAPVPETVAFSIKASNGYGTFCSEYPVQFTPNDNVEAFIATGINDAKTSIQTQKIEDGYVPAGVGVIVKASAAGDYTVHTTEATDVEELAGNMMVGCTEATAVPSEGCYIIYAGDGCFHPCFTGTIPASKAYLNIAPETVSPTEGKVLDIIEGNIDPTAINEIETTTENAAIYTLGGVRVKDAQQKGIYIINGKKVVK